MYQEAQFVSLSEGRRIRLKGRGQNAEAIKLMEKCVQLRTRVLGADHPHTLSSSATLIGWQTERLEIDVSAAKVPGNNNMVSQKD